MRRSVGLLLAMCGAAAWACQSAGPVTAVGPNGSVQRRAPAGSQRSNVLRADYVGSEACAGCHAPLYAAWQRAPMHRMTRDLAQTEVSAPFDGRSLRLGNDTARLELHDGKRFLALAQGNDAPSLFRVTKVIGGRYREDFVGEEVSASAPLGKALAEQRILPLSYLRFDGTLRYKGYSVMVRERDVLEPGLVWQRACILCHNTAPQFVALYDELYGAGSPAYQGSASNELPENKAFRYVIDDPAGLKSALEAELHLLGADGRLPDKSAHALEIAISNTRERWNESHLVELGVGCESCHGGARAHAADPRNKTSFAVESAFMHVETPTGGVPTHAQDINRSCAKCHTVLFSQYPYTWEGGERRRHPGGSTTNSGEARDFLLGGCASAMDCTSCHDPHGEDSKSRLDELGSVAGNRVCTSCHDKYASAAALKQHSHHTPDGEGSACLNCHMPKKNMGLAYEFTRYHRIGSPTDEARVTGDRPLDCAICHAERSVDQIVSTMEKWWGKHYDRAALKRLYGGDLTQNPVRLALLGGKPHEQALAADIAARHDLAGTTDAIVALFDNPYPLVRYFARHSLERRFGTPIPIDMNLTGPELVQSAKAWVASRAASR